MKYLKQFGVILLITFIGEILKAVIPLNIPASIYGLLLMFIALQAKLIKINHIYDVAIFLIEIMPLMFIPSAAGLLDSWETLKPIFVPVIIITVTSTIVVMVVTGLVTQLVIKMEGKKQNG